MYAYMYVDHTGGPNVACRFLKMVMAPVIIF